LPKLREAMEQNGIGLGSTSVSDGFSRQASQEQGQGNGNGGSSARGFRGTSGGGEDTLAAVTNVAAPARQSVGLVDTFV
jgi:flagellar hook-length control protein FliK